LFRVTIQKRLRSQKSYQCFTFGLRASFVKPLIPQRIFIEVFKKTARQLYGDVCSLRISRRKLRDLVRFEDGINFLRTGWLLIKLITAATSKVNTVLYRCPTDLDQSQMLFRLTTGAKLFGHFFFFHIGLQPYTIFSINQVLPPGTKHILTKKVYISVAKLISYESLRHDQASWVGFGMLSGLRIRRDTFS
jgi:hypothetical protein